MKKNVEVKDIFLDTTIKSEAIEDEKEEEEIKLIEIVAKPVIKTEMSKPIETVAKPVITNVMILIPGVTVIPKLGKKFFNSNLEDEEDQIILHNNIPSIFTLDNKYIKIHEQEKFKDVSILNNGLVNIYSIKIISQCKIVQIEHDLIDDQRESNAKLTNRFVSALNIKVKVNQKDYNRLDKYVLIYGSVLKKCDKFDDQGYKIEKDKLTLDFLKINILNFNFEELKSSLKNIKLYINPIQNLTSYFNNFFTFFKGINENVITTLKNINLKTFFLYTIYNNLDDIITASSNDVKNVIENLTFENCYNSIIRFASFVETKIVNEYLNDDVINKFDFKIVELIDVIKDYSIYSEYETLKAHFLDYLLFEYTPDIKKYFLQEETRNHLQFVFFRNLVLKMKNYFLNIFIFCCFVKSHFDDELLKKNKQENNFYLCFECKSVVCVRCLKYHQEHKDDLCKFDVFEIDDLTKRIASELRTKQREKLENCFKKKIDNKRKYIILLDFVKVIISDYLAKKLLIFRQSEESFNIFKNFSVNNKSFIDLFLLHYNKNAETPFLNVIFNFKEDDHSKTFDNIQNKLFNPKKKKKN